MMDFEMGKTTHICNLNFNNILSKKEVFVAFVLQELMISVILSCIKIWSDKIGMNIQENPLDIFINLVYNITGYDINKLN